MQIDAPWKAALATCRPGAVQRDHARQRACARSTVRQRPGLLDTPTTGSGPIFGAVPRSGLGGFRREVRGRAPVNHEGATDRMARAEWLNDRLLNLNDSSGADRFAQPGAGRANRGQPALALQAPEGRNPAGLRLRTDPQKARSQRAFRGVRPVSSSGLEPCAGAARSQPPRGRVQRGRLWRAQGTMLQVIRRGAVHHAPTGWPPAATRPRRPGRPGSSR